MFEKGNSRSHDQSTLEQEEALTLLNMASEGSEIDPNVIEEDERLARRNRIKPRKSSSEVKFTLVPLYWWFAYPCNCVIKWSETVFKAEEVSFWSMVFFLHLLRRILGHNGKYSGFYWPRLRPWESNFSNLPFEPLKVRQQFCLDLCQNFNHSTCKQTNA